MRNAMTDDERLDHDDIEAAPIPDNQDLANIAAMAKRYIDLEDTILKLEQELALKKADLKTLREGSLPLALTEVGMTSFKMNGGISVILKTGHVASISEANRPAAHAWLEKSGNGAIIKHQITIQFGKGEEAWAKKFLRDLSQRKRPLKYERKDTVHPQTLGAFVREKIASAREQGLSPERQIPFDLLGVFELRYAEVTNRP